MKDINSDRQEYLEMYFYIIDQTIKSLQTHYPSFNFSTLAAASDSQNLLSTYSVFNKTLQLLSKQNSSSISVELNLSWLSIDLSYINQNLHQPPLSDLYQVSYTVLSNLKSAADTLTFNLGSTDLKLAKLARTELLPIKVITEQHYKAAVQRFPTLSSL